MTRDEINEEYLRIISLFPKTNPTSADYLFARERSYEKFKELPVDEALNLLLDLSDFLEDPENFVKSLKRLGMSEEIIEEATIISKGLKILAEENANVSQKFSPKRD